MLNNLLQDSFIITGANGWLGRALINKLYEIYGKEIENKVFTDLENTIDQSEKNKDISQYSMGETKRKKLMNVLNDLIDLRKKIKQGD